MPARRHVPFALLMFWAVAVIPARPAVSRASWVEPLFMPGEVAEKHASVEKECTKCHRPFDKEEQDSLCLACHTDVKNDLAARRGYHGRSAELEGRRCQSCHTEHEGRGANIVALDRETFDHRTTDMPLRGGHRDAPCDGCHREGARYREASPDCGTCHGGDEPHEGSLGGSCDVCHEESAWSAVRFDHEVVAFSLRDRHREAPCAGCHATRRFVPTAHDCRACHEEDDRHRGGLGAACHACHDPSGWKISFDHARKTHFPLVGKHATTPCEDCHTAQLTPRDTPTACPSCHASDDAHGGRFGPQCQSCHTPIAWPLATFDHARDTDFPLRGRHDAVDCISCHRTQVDAAPMPTDCNSCHRDRDVHRGREGARCDTCHDERDWSHGVLFDHDATRFPLTGAHQRTACRGCHLSPRFKDTGNDCVSCHELEDVHRGKSGERCESCHDATSWKVIHGTL